MMENNKTNNAIFVTKTVVSLVPQYGSLQNKLSIHGFANRVNNIVVYNTNLNPDFCFGNGCDSPKYCVNI